MSVISASPLWRTALLLLIVMLVAEGRELRAVPASLAPSTWASCQQTVCSRVRDEAEGLARLKLLRGYVTETVKLLDSLMDSMDGELVQIAKEMKDFVGPRCEAAHQLLGQVAEAMPRRDLELSSGIMEESTAQRVVDAQTSGREEQDSGREEQDSGREEQDSATDQRGYDSDSQGWSRPDPGSTGYYPGTGRELGNGQQQSLFSSRKGIDERSSTTSSSSGRGIDNNANSVYSEEDTQDTRDGQAVWRTGPGAGGQQVGTRGQGRQLDQGTTGGSQHRGSVGAAGVSKGGSQGHESAEETYQTSGSSQYNTALAPKGGSQYNTALAPKGSSQYNTALAPKGRSQYNTALAPTGGSPGTRVVSGRSSWRPVTTGPNCRGRRGSPYAVPGIDSWCVQNCAGGYCPQTHCICE